MAVAVTADLMAAVVYAAHRVGIFLGRDPRHEEGRYHAMCVQKVEQGGQAFVDRVGAVGEKNRTMFAGFDLVQPDRLGVETNAEDHGESRHVGLPKLGFEKSGEPKGGLFGQFLRQEVAAGEPFAFDLFRPVLPDLDDGTSLVRAAALSPKC